jgi:O-antigen/teichoic acid export membrane protein
MTGMIINPGKRSVFRDTVFYSLAGALSALTPLALLPLLTRVLSVGEYAYYVLISSAVGLLIPFIGFGAVNAVIVRFFQLQGSELKIYLSSTLRVLVFSAVFFIIVALVLRDLVPRVFEPGISFLLFSIGMAFLSSFALLFAPLYVASADSVGYLRTYAAYGLGLFAATVFFCAVLELGLIGACFGMAFGYLAFAVSSYLGSEVAKVGRSWSFAHARDALGFGFPLMIHSAGVVFISFCDRFAVAKWVGTEAVAAYGVTAQLALIAGYFFHSVNKVIQPRVYSLLKVGRAFDQRIAVSYVYLYCFAVIALTTLYALAFPFLVLWLAGESYQVVPEVYCFVILGGAFNSMYLGFAHFVFFTGKTFKLSLVTLVSAGSYVGLLLFLSPRYGLSGIAFSFALTNGLMLFMTILLARLSTDVQWLDRSLLYVWRVKASP